MVFTKVFHAALAAWPGFFVDDGQLPKVAEQGETGYLVRGSPHFDDPFVVFRRHHGHLVDNHQVVLGENRDAFGWGSVSTSISGWSARILHASWPVGNAKSILHPLRFQWRMMSCTTWVLPVPGGPSANKIRLLRPASITFCSYSSSLAASCNMAFEMLFFMFSLSFRCASVSFTLGCSGLSWRSLPLSPSSSDGTSSFLSTSPERYRCTEHRWPEPC